MTYAVGQLCIRTMYFSINDPTAYVICSTYSIPVFPYFVKLRSHLWHEKYISHSFHFLENDYLHEKLQCCLKIWNQNFSLHRHFKLLRVAVSKYASRLDITYRFKLYGFSHVSDCVVNLSTKRGLEIRKTRFWKPPAYEEDWYFQKACIVHKTTTHQSWRLYDTLFINLCPRIKT